MSTMVPMYGFGGGGGAGATLTVNAPAGCTVTVSKDGKTKTKVAGTDRVAVFKGLATGTWTVNMTDGAQTAPERTADITADYAITMSFFSATIHITYPAGSTCTATDGVTTLTAPDTSGTWDCVVPNAGTWTVSLDSGFSEKVTVTEMDGTYTIDKWYLYNRGDEHEEVTGGWNNTDWKYSSDAVGYLDKGDDYLQINGGTKYKYAGATNLIAFSGFSTLYAEILSEGTETYEGTLYSVTVALKNEKTANKSGTTVASVKVGSASSKVKTVSVSLNNTVDSAYIACYTVKSSGVKGKVYSIWLEV